MTENEAIERIKDHMEIHKLNEPRAIYITVALSMAISALKEIQQYREIGSVKECKEMASIVKKSERSELANIIDEWIEYRKIGTVEECKEMAVIANKKTNPDELAKIIVEWIQYNKIGTVEECREAVEKQRPKAPIMKPYYDDMPDEEYLCCPTCGDILTDRIPADNKNFYFHCLNCGQKFDWSDDTNE